VTPAQKFSSYGSELPQKSTAPTPDGREGRLFPPEQSWKTLTLVNELTASGNKFLPELIRGAVGDCKEDVDLSRSPVKSRLIVCSNAMWRLRVLA